MLEFAILIVADLARILDNKLILFDRLRCEETNELVTQQRWSSENLLDIAERDVEIGAVQALPTAVLTSVGIAVSLDLATETSISQAVLCILAQATMEGVETVVFA